MAITRVSFLRNKAIILHKVKSQNLKVKTQKSEFDQKVFTIAILWAVVAKFHTEKVLENQIFDHLQKI